MMESKIKGIMRFPYGHLITKILEKTGFNVENVEYLENYARIGNHAIGQINIEINDRVLTQSQKSLSK